MYPRFTGSTDSRPLLRRCLVGAIAATGLWALLPAAASAYDGNRDWWNRAWSNQESGSSWSQSFDQTFSSDSRSNQRSSGLPTVSPENISLIQSAIKKYEAIAKSGGWEAVPAVQMGYGSSGKPVELLRKRLAATGDLRENSKYSAASYDSSVTNAVKQFQSRHGLEVTGVLSGENGKRTVAAMNVPAQARLLQLRRNLDRIRSLNSSSGKRYVLVNIPAAQIEAVEDGRVVSVHTAVIGKPERPTPVLTSSIYEINFNKDWILPPTVVSEDLIPKGRKMSRSGQDVLTRYKIDAYTDYTAYQKGRKIDTTKINWQSGQPHNLYYAQGPGPENPLGFVKINFGNDHDVYLHDTPSKTIFNRNFRAASSGCVRVDDIGRLVAWLLEDNSRDKNNWSVDMVAQMKKSGEQRNVGLKKSVTLHLAYVTAWATQDGVINFRSDLYGHDRRYGVSRLASAY